MLLNYSDNKKAAHSPEQRLSFNEKSRGVAGPAALRFYVVPSQKPSGGPLEYKYYHYGCNYMKFTRQSVMGHTITIIMKFHNIILELICLSSIFWIFWISSQLLC